MQAQAGAVEVVGPAAFSDQELYQRGRHAQAAPAHTVYLVVADAAAACRACELLTESADA